MDLSAESLAFREEMRAKNSAGSTSAILDGILQSVRAEGKRSAMEMRLVEYYDSLTDADVAGIRQWGEFARRGLLGRERG